jgi:Zn-dependent alcohol dehydrogenase
VKMRAAVLRQSGAAQPFAETRPLSIEDVTLDEPGADEVLVRMRAAGLCHSDLSVIDGSRPRGLPMVLGHEACGDVVTVGPGVSGLTSGDRVVFSFVPSCGHCAPCAAGRPALCEPGATANVAGSLLSGARRLRDHSGATLHHHLGVSAFAEYAVASARSVIRVPHDLEPEIAALFGCAVLTGVGAVTNTARVAPGESVAVFGLGGVGLAAVLGAAASGAQPIVAVDPIAGKRALALALGASAAFDPREGDVVARLREATDGGAAFVIETVGSEVVLAQAYGATRRGGTTVSVGLPAPSRQLAISALSLVVEERTLKGSYMGSSVPSRDVARFVGLHRGGRLPVERLLSRTLALDEINDGFDRLARGEVVRQVVLFP